MTSAIADPIQELQHQRERIYEEVRGLRLDYDLGQIREKEYETRFQGHRLRAATLLRQQLQLETWSQRLEEEVQTLWESPTESNAMPLCSKCMEPMPKGLDQCPSCGTQPTDATSALHETGNQ